LFRVLQNIFDNRYGKIRGSKDTLGKIKKSSTAHNRISFILLIFTGFLKSNYSKNLLGKNWDKISRLLSQSDILAVMRF